MQEPSIIADRIISEARVQAVLADLDAELGTLAAREAELRHRREVVVRVIEMFDDSELGDLMLGSTDGEAGKVIVAAREAAAAAAAVSSNVSSTRPSHGQSVKVSQRSRILQVMQRNGDFMTPVEISQDLLEHYDIVAHRTTVSSQLQKLRDLGRVENTGAGWRLTRSGDASAKASPEAEGISPS